MTSGIPAPTKWELILIDILHKRKVPVSRGRIIWYTTSEKYSPDLLIGNDMIVEVEGSVHDHPRMKTKDRIRRRALEAMGYKFLIIKNWEIKYPDTVAEKIIQYYYETIEFDKQIKVIQIMPKSQKRVPIDLLKKIEEIAKKINPFLIHEAWTPTLFIGRINQIDSRIQENQGFMDKLMLLCFGLNLRLVQNHGEISKLDFCYSLSFFERSLSIMTYLYGEGGTVGMKNLLNISAPNFFKNIVFLGGPKINPGIIRIPSAKSLKLHIVDFNVNFKKVGIVVEEDDVILECCEALKNKPEGSLSNQLVWIKELCMQIHK
jgi:hypothetical protein